MKVAFVTGGSHGIGKAIARGLAEDHFVYICGRNEEALLSAQKEIGSDRCGILAGDITDESTQDKWVTEIQPQKRQLDVFVSNVGSGKSSNDIQVPMEEWQRMFEVNFFQAVSMTQRILGLMKAGNIIFISSIAGVMPIGAPISYEAAKSALNMYSKELALRLAPKIRVNAISPGNVMFEGSTWDDKMQNKREWTENYIKKNVPLNKFVEPETISQWVRLILNSPSATAQNYIVDAGQTRGVSG